MMAIGLTASKARKRTKAIDPPADLINVVASLAVLAGLKCPKVVVTTCDRRSAEFSADRPYWPELRAITGSPRVIVARSQRLQGITEEDVRFQVGMALTSKPTLSDQMAWIQLLGFYVVLFAMALLGCFAPVPAGAILLLATFWWAKENQPAKIENLKRYAVAAVMLTKEPDTALRFLRQRLGREVEPALEAEIYAASDPENE
jgi:hypothetical protein